MKPYLILRVGDVLSPLPGYWSGRTSDLHFETNGCSSSLTLASFNRVLPVLVEDYVDLHTVVGKERGTEDAVVVF